MYFLANYNQGTPSRSGKKEPLKHKFIVRRQETQK